MNKGIIFTFLSYIASSFSGWFEDSVLEKIGTSVGRLWHRVSKNSFFVNWFSNSSGKCTFRDKSFVFRFVKSVFLFFRRVGTSVFPYVANSAIVSGFNRYFDGFFDVSVANYGIFGICFAAVYAVLSALGGGAVFGLLTVAVGTFSVLLIALNRSVAQLVSGSAVSKAVFKFLNIDIGNAKESIGVTAVSGTVAALLGAVSAFLSYKVGVIYGIGAVCGAVFVAAALYNYRLGVYAALVAFPFAPTMAIVGLMLLSLVSLVLRYICDGSFKFRRTTLDIPIAFFLAVMLVSSLTSFARASSIKIYMVYFVFISGYYVITNTFDSFKKIIPVLVLMLISALGVSAYGIYQHIFGFAEGTTWTDTDMFKDIATRVVSTFENPNVLGEYLLLLIPLGVSLFLTVRGGFSKVGHLAITAAMCVCMIYTYSRGNWIGLIFAAVLFVLFYDTRFVWLGVIAILLAPAMLSATVISRFTSIGDTKDTSTSYRVYVWLGTLAMLKDYWLCGIGPGSDAFNMIYPHYSYAGIVAPHSHNLYLQLLAEYGILGLLVFLVIVFAFYKAVISKITALGHGVKKAVITASAAGIFGFLVQGMFDNVWYNYRVFFMFFALLALTMAAVNAAKGGIVRD